MSVHGSESSLRESSYFSSTVSLPFLVSKSSKMVAPAAPFSSSLGTWWLILFLVPSVVPKLRVLESLCGLLSSLFGSAIGPEGFVKPRGVPFGYILGVFRMDFRSFRLLSASRERPSISFRVFSISYRPFSVSFRLVFTVVAIACYHKE